MDNLEIKEIHNRLKDIEIKLTRIETKFEDLTKKIECIEKEIQGNGRKGIKQRIEDLEKFEYKIIGIAIGGTFIANYIFKILISK